MVTTGNQPTIFIVVAALIILLYNGKRGNLSIKIFLLLVLSSTYIASLWCIASVQIRNALALPGHFSK
jgi:hypothetical protein